MDAEDEDALDEGDEVHVEGASAEETPDDETDSRGWKDRRKSAMLDELTGVLKPSAVSAYMQRTMHDLRQKRKKAALFCIGLYGLLARRNAVAMLMAVELSLNAVNLNLVAFWRYVDPSRSTGIAWAIFVLTVAAAEAAVGLALIISIYRQRDSVITEELDVLKY